MADNLIVCGGTFDHFHLGHQSLLSSVLSSGGKAIVGVTSDVYIQNSKYPEQIESFEKRKQSVLDFVKKKNALRRVNIIEINDMFGPTLSEDMSIHAIVVSEESKKGADIINQKRKELGLNPLKVYVVPVVKAQDGKPISSARIRNGEINREGMLYVKGLWLEKDLKLTENLRDEFQKPFGEIFKNIDNISESKNYLLITVGDITAKNFNKKSSGQNLSVIDFKVAREKKFSKLSELGFAGNENIFKVDNSAGYITSALFRKLAEIMKTGLKGKTILQVNGEEDLAVLPLILLSPLNTVIYYGQPGKGVAKITVSETSKNKAYSLISRLKIM